MAPFIPVFICAPVLSICVVDTGCQSTSRPCCFSPTRRTWRRWGRCCTTCTNIWTAVLPSSMWVSFTHTHSYQHLVGRVGSDRALCCRSSLLSLLLSHLDSVPSIKATVAKVIYLHIYKTKLQNYYFSCRYGQTSYHTFSSLDFSLLFVFSIHALWWPGVRYMTIHKILKYINMWKIYSIY